MRKLLMYSDMYDVRAVCDLKGENLAEAKQAGFDNCFQDYRQVLDMKELEAVFVITPQYTHKEIAVASLDAGKDVYLEKPMALTIKDCDAIEGAARRNKRLLMLGLQMRYHKHLKKIADLIEQGEIGKPMMLWLTEHRNPFPATMTWVFDKAKGGGMLVDKNCHHFDIFNWYAGSKPVRVFASGGLVNKEIFGIKPNISDFAWVTVEYESGCKAMLGICMFAGLPHEKEYGLGIWVRKIGVQGTKGMLETEGFELGHGIVEQRYIDSGNVTRHNLSEKQTILTQFNQDGNKGVWYEWYECLTQRREPFTNAKNGKDSLAVSLAAEKSLDEGRPVEMSEILGENK